MRIEKGLYQKDLAKLVGVSPDTVTNWEKDRTVPLRKSMERLREVLGID